MQLELINLTCYRNNCGPYSHVNSTKEGKSGQQLTLDIWAKCFQLMAYHDYHNSSHVQLGLINLEIFAVVIRMLTQPLWVKTWVYQMRAHVVSFFLFVFSHALCWQSIDQ